MLVLNAYHADMIRMTSGNEDVDELIAFLDANIVLEGKPVTNLPWEEVTREGLVRVLIVPKAMDEIDAKKRDGRLGPHARAFNRLIAASIVDGKPVVLREEYPRVELQMATCSRIPWSNYGELDPDDGDSRIVAEALHVRNVASGNRILISHDIKPLAYAKGQNLAVFLASDNWLRGLEPSPKDKEIQRLKQQLAEFKKDEPVFEISIEILHSEPMTVYRVAALGVEQTDTLTRTIRLKNPRKANGRETSFGSSLGIMSDRDSSYDEKYRIYTAKTVPAFAAKFSEKLELAFNQRLLTIRVTNAGQIRADHLVVTIRTNDGWINRRLVYVSPGGPAPPVPSPDYLHGMNVRHNAMRDLIRPRVGRHEFETIVRARRSHENEASCEDFRSGQEYCFEGVLAPSSNDDPLEVTVTLTAKNMRGEHAKVFRVNKEVSLVEASDLADLETLKLKVEYPTRGQFERLLKSEQYGEIEWDDRGKDD